MTASRLLFLLLFSSVCIVTSCVLAQSQKTFQVDTEFPGGNGVVEKIEGDTITLHQDLRDTQGWWFYWCFRVRGAAGRTLTVNFTDRTPIGVRGPAVSLDEGQTWSWIGKQPSRKSFSYSIPSTAESVRFSFGMTYTEANLKTFLKTIGRTAALKQEILCRSRKGRAVEQLRVGKIDGAPRFRTLLTCRAHCCEMMTSYVAEGLITAALANDKTGQWFRDNVELLFIPFVDKDGVEDGDQGKNRRPRDHNRDFDSRGLYPETTAIQKFVPTWSKDKLRLTLDLHCPSIGGGIHEVIHIVGSDQSLMWREQQKFAAILERVQQGPLVYSTTNNLPFGQSWNVEKNFKAGPSVSRWASQIPGVKLATTIEVPYANASGGEVNATTARAFGHDLSRAIREYLESTGAE